MSKDPDTTHPVHAVISGRWSPYGFSSRAISASDLGSLFEAARWAPSSFNEQPWRFIVATRAEGSEFDRILSCLVEPNQAWAKDASVLALAVASTRFARNGRDNRHSFHDVGLAVANLSVEATARGISVHQMAGILPERAVEEFGIPEGHEAVTGIAIGYPAEDVSALPDGLRERDEAPRSRRALSELVFTGEWGRARTFRED